MRVVGVTNPVGAPVVQFDVDHGAHPQVTLFSHGYVPLRPLSAALGTDNDIVYTCLVREATSHDRRPIERHSIHVRGGGTPVDYQRVGVYALVTSTRGLLGTVNSSLTGAPGVWTLPGGGVDLGESPSDALTREIYEETGQNIVITRILTLESEHWIGRSLTGRLEDFHALRLIYAATCQSPSEPVVHDVGGSTASAGWVSLRSWRRLHWTNSSRMLLARYSRQLPRVAG